MEQNFKVKGRVRINKNSWYYNENTHDNPADVTGTITYINSSGEYDVNWDNGSSNHYTASDLELAPTEFKVGDKVRIKSSSKYYGEDCEHNPKNVTGEIIELSYGDYPFRVKWPNGTNSYKKSDLELAPKEEIVETKHGFKIGDKVKIKLNGAGAIDICDYHLTIPQIMYGGTYTNGDGEVIGFHKELIAVRYTDHKGKIVQLGFEKRVLTLINNKPKQHDKSKNTSGIKVCRATPTISRNQRCTGNGIRGNGKRATITIGHLGYKEVIGS
jgi:uncharacterized protein YodC (DUF2158 family)